MDVGTRINKFITGYMNNEMHRVVQYFVSYIQGA